MKPTSPTITLSSRFRLLSWSLAVARFIARAHNRHFQRIDLAELDDRLLDDIGLDRRSVERECAKPCWQR